MDYYQKRYNYEKTFKYHKFINLEQSYTTNDETEVGSINLIIQTYPIPRFEKLEELLLCLHNNLNNKCIKRIYNLYESNIDFLPNFIKNHKKLINIKVDKNSLEYIHTYIPDFDKIKNIDYVVNAYKNGGIDQNTNLTIFHNNIKDRLTWNYFIDFCLKTFKDDDVICVANCDIIIEDSVDWFDISNYLNENVSLCLSRHEIDKDGNTFVNFDAFKCWSQDCWVFKKTYKTSLLKSSIDFSIGNCLSCDNVIAGIMMTCNYIPINYAFKYRIFHLDRVTKPNGSSLVISRTHDNRLIEHITLLPTLYVCPFLNYNKLIVSPQELIKTLLTTKNICKLKEYHEH